MIANDFEYDGVRASNFGLMMCSFDGGGGIETISIGAEINYNTSAIAGGKRFDITNTTYDNPLECTFQVCKKDCLSRENYYFDVHEQRAIARWLNREEDHMFRIQSDEAAYDYVQFEGKFNINKIEFNGFVVGFELHFISNRPYAIGHLEKHVINATTPNFTYKFYDISDKVGYIYPKIMTITCNQACNLVIKNKTEDRDTRINNCTSGEVITFTDSLTVSTTKDHAIQNDFNYTFFRIANSYNNRLNEIVISHPCVITFEYYPVVKGVGL